MARKKVTLYTDGACSGNPGPGGWAGLLMFNGHERVVTGAEKETTNNRMELTAALTLLEQLAVLPRDPSLTIRTDSKYLIDGFSKWINGWKRNGWKTSAKKDVKNADLWKRLDEEVSRHSISWQWVKGHSGNAGNELADELANRGVDSAR